MINTNYPTILGFSLIETLIATLLFSITLLGLNRYQQTLAVQFKSYAAQQQAWRLANHLLELYPNQLQIEDSRLSHRIKVIDNHHGCQHVEASVEYQNTQVALSRWLCRTAVVK